MTLLRNYLTESEKAYIVTFTYNSENILNGDVIYAKDDKEVFNKSILRIISKFKQHNINKSFSHLYSYYNKHPDRYIIKIKPTIIKKNNKELKQGSLLDL